MTDVTAPGTTSLTDDLHHLRFTRLYGHLVPAFGSGGFGQKAEAFARFFGTPVFLLGQSAIVVTWIVLNAVGVFSFDLYPFILLNLAFSTQAAYAAPLILLAQTRQADRDKAHADADAQHREALATAAVTRQEQAMRHQQDMAMMLASNTRVTNQVHELAENLARLTREIHATTCSRPA